MHPKFWACSLQESCHSHCLLVKVNLWLLCDLIVQLNSLENVPQAPETIFISSLFLVSVKDILSELGWVFFHFLSGFLSFSSFHI